MEFIELFNGVVKLAKPVSAETAYAKSLDDKIKDLGIDSLDTIMISMYFSEIYGIEDEVMHEMKVETIADLQAFLEAKKTRIPADNKTELARVK